MAASNEVKKIFGVQDNTRTFNAPIGGQSKGILDDYAVRKNVATREGTVEKVPVNPKDIANKAYVDSVAGVSQVEDSIVDGHTTIAPSGNAVFDALALKSPLASPTFTGTLTAPIILTTTDNTTADQAYTPMVLYNTDATPPTASNFPIGTIYIQYT